MGKANKFKTGEQLVNAYNSLEAEFTKRSQRLKELEAELSKLQAQNEKNAAPPAALSGGTEATAGTEYAAPVLHSGMGRSALTPVKKPKSLAEAKALADILLNN